MIGNEHIHVYPLVLWEWGLGEGREEGTIEAKGAVRGTWKEGRGYRMRCDSSYWGRMTNWLLA